MGKILCLACEGTGSSLIALLHSLKPRERSSRFDSESTRYDPKDRSDERYAWNKYRSTTAFEVWWQLGRLPNKLAQKGPLEYKNYTSTAHAIEIDARIPTRYPAPRAAHLVIVRHDDQHFLSNVWYVDDYGHRNADVALVLAGDEVALCEANLHRWIASGEPSKWIDGKGGSWAHEDWVSLLASLQQSRFWPLDKKAVGRIVETLKVRVSRERATEIHL